MDSTYDPAAEDAGAGMIADDSSYAIGRPLARQLLWGMLAVLAGASLLVLRAFLPRWTFGAPVAIDARWPLAVFCSYLALGGTALVAIVAIQAWVRERTFPVWQELLFGAKLIVAALGVTLYAAVPAICLAVVGRKPASLSGFWILSAMLAVSAYAWLVMHKASRRQRQQAQRLQIDTDQLARDLARAELALLDAQIEPHFLFNTLAHIKRDYRQHVPDADRLLGMLIDYLERATPALRRADWTIGDEIELIRVYLEILAQRFGTRLNFTLVVPHSERAFQLPALTVATLVENAVRHGVAPKPEGGTVTVGVRRERGAVSIEVGDDGVGLRHGSGGGLGLATVRARLRGMFGERAALLVEPRGAGGVRAVITIAED